MSWLPRFKGWWHLLVLHSFPPQSFSTCRAEEPKHRLHMKSSLRLLEVFLIFGREARRDNSSGDVDASASTESWGTDSSFKQRNIFRKHIISFPKLNVPSGSQNQLDMRGCGSVEDVSTDWGDLKSKTETFILMSFTSQPQNRWRKQECCHICGARKHLSVWIYDSDMFVEFMKLIKSCSLVSSVLPVHFWGGRLSVAVYGPHMVEGTGLCPTPSAVWVPAWSRMLGISSTHWLVSYLMCWTWTRRESEAGVSEMMWRVKHDKEIRLMPEQNLNPLRERSPGLREPNGRLG